MGGASEDGVGPVAGGHAVLCEWCVGCGAWMGRGGGGEDGRVWGDEGAAVRGGWVRGKGR